MSPSLTLPKNSGHGHPSRTTKRTGHSHRNNKEFNPTVKFVITCKEAKKHSFADLSGSKPHCTLGYICTDTYIGKKA